MALSSHNFPLTRHPPQQIQRGGCLVRGLWTRAAILTLVTAFYTRGQMALSSHNLSLTRHPPQQIHRGGCLRGGSQESTRPNRFDAVAGLSGGNIDPAPWRTGLTWQFVMLGDIWSSRQGAILILGLNRLLRWAEEQRFQRRKHHQTWLQPMRWKLLAG